MTNRDKLIELYNQNLKSNRITVVKTKNNDYYLMIGPDLFVNRTGFMYYDNDDLTTNNSKFNIIAVYTKAVGGSGLDHYNVDLKHQHTFVIELTMQEIADKFGIDVNQLKIKK